MTTARSATTSAIEEVDGSARLLHRRARDAGQDFADIAAVVKSLHTGLRYLRDEADDPDSLLNTPQRGGSVYARQLTPIVEDCDFALKQLDAILERCGHGGDGGSGPPPALESREKDMVALVRTKLANQKTNIDIFLDTVQLHNPAHPQRAAPGADSQLLEDIKDKADAVASRLVVGRRHRRRSSSIDDGSDEELWQQFCAELVKEGFSSDVLHRNKVWSHPPSMLSQRCATWTQPADEGDSFLCF